MTDIFEEVYGKLHLLTFDELLTLHDHFKLPALVTGKESKSYLLRVILRYLGSDEVENSADEGEAIFKSIKDSIDKKGDGSKVPKKEGIPNTGDSSKSNTSVSAEESLPTTAGSLKDILKKEFKIKGSIGLPGQKDKLSFSSLLHQIESGRKKGYSEDDICTEVVRAISPGLQLRSFLEGKADLTLKSLGRILRAHYQEQDATTLYKGPGQKFDSK